MNKRRNEGMNREVKEPDLKFAPDVIRKVGRIYKQIYIRIRIG